MFTKISQITSWTDLPKQKVRLVLAAILPPQAGADTRDVHVPGPIDGIGHEAMAALVEPVSPGGRRAEESVPQRLLRDGHPSLLNVVVQLV